MVDFQFPSFQCDDAWLTRVYAYRCEAFCRHIRPTPEGYVITEFLPDVPWAGAYNTIPCAAEFHVRQARWLNDPAVAGDYLAFWCDHLKESRKYSFPLAHAVYQRGLATGDLRVSLPVYGKLCENFEAWQTEHGTPDGMFAQACEFDGMEYAASGNGIRPTLNSYMVAESRALADFSARLGKEKEAAYFDAFSRDLRRKTVERLYDKAVGFYLTENENGVKNTALEQVGYVPFAYGVADPGQEGCFEELWKPDGFYGAYGPTTLVRRDPRYGGAFDHECLWNGPSWPFATSQTLQALIACEQDDRFCVPKGSFMRLLTVYANGQQKDGEPYVDEDLDPDTGEWIARRILHQWGRPDRDRGQHYNHSAFVDLIVTGLVGIMPRPDNTLEVRSLAGTMPFDMEHIPYHGHSLTVGSDGNTVTLWVDGGTAATAPVGQPLFVPLP